MPQINQIRMLIRMAKIDGILSKDEIVLIQRMAQHYGYSKTEVDELLAAEESDEVIEFSALNADDCFECLYTVLQLMKIDGRLYPEEIDFCRRMAQELGYDDAVLYQFMQHVKEADSAATRDHLKAFVNTRPRSSKSN